jgi:manganese-dependent ADP-ribose/CDP-alcohol diphosphatase
VRRHHKGKAADGLLTSWVPEEGDDPALWHMVHDKMVHDGKQLVVDAEDLEQSEVEDALAAYAARRPAATGSSKGKAPVARPAAGSKFSIGLIADVQYADQPAGTSHDGSTDRHYRNALNTLSRAVEWWGRLPNVQLTVQLGDLIDRSNKALGQSMAALEKTLAVLRHAPCEPMHVLGNHDLYNFSRAQLAQLVQQTGYGASYYSVTAGCGWRVVVVDSYQRSNLGWPEGDSRHTHAMELLREQNHNIAAGMDDWLEGMRGLARRFTPLNGALGKEQRVWLRAELEAAARQAQRVILLSHCVVHPKACDGTTMLWDCDEVLRLIHDVGVVAAVICGHDHNGGYHLDEKGVHHLTLCSPLGKHIGEAYGALEVHENHLQLSSPRLTDLVGGSHGQAMGRLTLPPLPPPRNACTRVLLLRHGQSEANAHPSRSIADPLLTELGRHQVALPSRAPLPVLAALSLTPHRSRCGRPASSLIRPRRGRASDRCQGCPTSCSCHRCGVLWRPRRLLWKAWRRQSKSLA